MLDVFLFPNVTLLLLQLYYFSLFVAQVGDFGDTNSWPTPGEIATKDMQVGVRVCLTDVVAW